MLPTIIFFTSQSQEQDLKDILLDLLSEHPTLATIAVIIISVVTYFIWFTDFLSKLKSAGEGLEILKKRLFFWKKEPKAPVRSDSFIDLKKLLPITNPENDYVKKGENVDELIALIRDEGITDDKKKQRNQIIAVTGPAGVGKTRLVQEICNGDLSEDFKIQIYVDFEAVNSPEKRHEDTEDEIFEDAKIQMNKALGGIERDEEYHAIARHFQTPTILFIDNYEQVLDNPRLHNRIWKHIIRPFSAHNDLIKIIITSRAEIQEAKKFEVQRLSNTTKELAKTYDREQLVQDFTAVRLFCKIHNQSLDKKGRLDDKIPFSQEEFVTLVELCNAVSNLPLGIHLIASRSTEIKLAQIKENLDYYLKQPIPDIFGEFGDRHTDLYNVFRWSFNSLSEEEKAFYKHLTYYQNGFYTKNLPVWPAFDIKEATDSTVSKLYRKSFLREQKYEGASEKRRYEVYILFKELLHLEDKHFKQNFNKEYLTQIHEQCHRMLEGMTEAVFGNRSDLNYATVKTDLRLEYENITYFIKECRKDQLPLAVDMLVMLEHLLNEVGPYLKLEPLFNSLLKKVEDNVQRARLLMAKARVIKSSENRKLSIDPIKEAIALLKQEGSVSSTLGDAYRIGTYLSNQLSDYDLGAVIYKEVAELPEAEQLQLGTLNLGFVLSEKAKALERKGQIQAAIDQFEEVVTLMEGYKVQQAKVLNFLGMLHWRLGDADQAIANYKKAIDLYKGIGEDRWILGFQTNIGLVYCDKGDLDTSQEVTAIAYETLKHQGPYGWTQINQLNSGRILSRHAKKQKHFDAAEKILLETFKEFKSLHYWETYILNGVELAELYYKYRDYKQALDYAQLSLEKATEVGLTKWMRYFRVLCLAGLSYSQLGNKNESAKKLAEASEVLQSVEGNNWLSYEIPKLRYEQLKKVHD